MLNSEMEIWIYYSFKLLIGYDFIMFKIFQLKQTNIFLWMNILITLQISIDLYLFFI